MGCIFVLFKALVISCIICVIVVILSSFGNYMIITRNGKSLATEPGRLFNVVLDKVRTNNYDGEQSMFFEIPSSQAETGGLTNWQ